MLTETLGFAESGDDFTLGGFTLGLRRAPGSSAASSAPAPSTTSPGPPATRTISPGSSASATAGLSVSDVRDRDYFQSIYFGEPRGILFEIATLSPGFAVDEDPEHLGEALRLPKMHEHLRSQLERVLTPLTNPREELVR